jgi:hypothetical protein
MKPVGQVGNDPVFRLVDDQRTAGLLKKHEQKGCRSLTFGRLLEGNFARTVAIRQCYFRAGNCCGDGLSAGCIDAFGKRSPDAFGIAKYLQDFR